WRSPPAAGSGAGGSPDRPLGPGLPPSSARSPPRRPKAAAAGRPPAEPWSWSFCPPPRHLPDIFAVKRQEAAPPWVRLPLPAVTTRGETADHRIQHLPALVCRIASVDPPKSSREPRPL